MEEEQSQNINQKDPLLQLLDDFEDRIKKNDNDILRLQKVDTLERLRLAYKNIPIDLELAEREFTTFIAVATTNLEPEGEYPYFKKEELETLEPVIQEVVNGLYPKETERQRKLDELFDIWRD